ncbi:MAG TPA: PQQ-binding-like beta-propeller repeat protein [Vicinamibacterales bacterium]|nr:PQQ-binding-like beta-propeller repeat protein [Vicinamibacterales bacterium]
MVVAVIYLTVAWGLTPPQSEGELLYDGACATCHDAPAANSRAPQKDALRQRSPEAIVDALTGGAMRYQGLSLSGAERRAVAEYLSGRILGGDLTGAAAARCSAPPAAATRAAEWNGWGPTLENTHFQSAEAAGLTAEQVPRLALKWAFGFPDTTSAWAQPTIVGGRLYVGSQNGTVYAMDPKSGCVIWTFTANGGVRASISIGSIDSPTSSMRTAAFLSDQKGWAYALDAATGKPIWSKKVEDHPLIRLTGSPALYDGRLYVPTSSYEEAGKSPGYACCTFRGSVVALDAKTGDVLWRAYTIGEVPHVMKHSDGRPDGTAGRGSVVSWGPAGGAIWSAPTIDRKRGVLYVGVGNTYAGAITQPMANAVVAIDVKSGKVLWAKQVAAPDIYGCRVGEANCGERPGPDFDFGSSPALAKLPDGRDVIVIGNKSGIGYAMDPDKQGAILWEYRAGKGGALGGIEWGAAVDTEQAYFPVADGNSPTPGGLHAVKLATGDRAWFTPPAPVKCTAGRGCNGAQSAAITVIPGIVFSPSMDGAVRAFSTKDGSIVWEYDSNHEFQTLNGVRARGGSMNGPAPVVVGGMLYVNSGYGAFGSRTGNVLLAFGVN